jgi:hypothetical protein
MFKLTRNLIIFAIIAIVLTVSFHWMLSSFLENETYGRILPLAIGYAVAMFANGWFNGSKDDSFLTRADLGFSYHAMTFMVVVPIWMIFAWLRPEVPDSSKVGESIGVAIWGVILLIHLFASRRSIKGYSKQEVFD